MQYLSEFEVLSEPIVPQPLAPGVTLPFVNQGWFLLLSRLADANPGDLQVKLTFVASGPLPTGAAAVPNQDNEGHPFILINYETGDDQQGNVPREVLIPGFTPEPGAGPNAVSASFPLGSGGTVLFGVQPDTVNFDPDGPLATGVFGWRGYVLIDAAEDLTSRGGTFQLAAVPEIRAVFFNVTLDQQGVPTPNLAAAQEVAYALPTANGPLITLTKAKENKDKFEKEKEALKDNKDIKDRKDTKEDFPDKPRLHDVVGPRTPAPGEPVELAALAQRLAAIEALIATEQPFIEAAERPKVG